MSDRAGTALDRLVRFIPNPVLVNPERVAIKTAVIVAGLAALLVVQPHSLNVLLPGWAVHLWGGTWALGGTLGLLGYWLPRRWMERTGHLLILVGAIEYGISAVRVIGSQAAILVVLLFVVCFSSIIRLLVAGTARRSRRRGGTR